MNYDALWYSDIKPLPRQGLLHEDASHCVQPQQGSKDHEAKEDDAWTKQKSDGQPNFQKEIGWLKDVFIYKLKAKGVFSAGLWFSKDSNLRLRMLPLSNMVFSHT